MPDDTNLVYGPHRVEALGDVQIASRGDGVFLSATDDDGVVKLEAGSGATVEVGPALLSLAKLPTGEGQLTLTCGDTGSVVQFAGAPDKGAKIIMTPDAILLSVGDPSTGSTLSLTAQGILLKVGTVTLALNSSGVEETVNPVVNRKVTATGHQTMAAMTSVEVGVQGLTVSAPLLKEDVMGLASRKAGMVQNSADVMEKVQAGVLMLG